MSAKLSQMKYEGQCVDCLKATEEVPIEIKSKKRMGEGHFSIRFNDYNLISITLDGIEVKNSALECRTGKNGWVLLAAGTLCYNCLKNTCSRIKEPSLFNMGTVSYHSKILALTMPRLVNVLADFWSTR